MSKPAAVIVLAALLLTPGLPGVCARAEPGYPADDDGYFLAEPPREWAFPRDFGRHDGFRIEWWYFTGNLRIAEGPADDRADPRSGQDLGFQLTFFRNELAPRTGRTQHAAGDEPVSGWRTDELFFGHFAISDLAAGRFVHAERTSRAHPRLAHASDREMDVRLLDWRIDMDAAPPSGGPPVIRLRASHDDHAIDLTCTIRRGPIFHGPGGVNRKGTERGQASYYYSLTRLETTGTVTLGGREHVVAGLSWMDHEFSSNQLSDGQEGWDWFSLQLDDGRDVMAYRLRSADGQTDFAFATIVTPGEGAAADRASWFTGGDVSLVGSEPWTSPATGGVYPLRWRVRIADAFDGVVRTRMDAQELTTADSTDISYYEGAVRVTDPAGEPIGRGYMELTGYADSLEGAF